MTSPTPEGTDPMTPDLIIRLEAAAEGSRELDEELAAVFAGATLERQKDGRASYHRDGFWVGITIEPWTTSLDAVTALVEDRLPGTYWTVNQNYWPEGDPSASRKAYSAEITNLKRDEDPERIYQEVAGPTPALALCKALLKALRALTPTKEGSEDDRPNS